MISLRELLSPYDVTCYGFASMLSVLSALQSTEGGFDRDTHVNVSCVAAKHLKLTMDFCSARLPTAVMNVVSSGALSGLYFLAHRILQPGVLEPGIWLFRSDIAHAFVTLAQLFPTLPRDSQDAGLADVGEAQRSLLCGVLLDLLRHGRDALPKFNDLKDTQKKLSRTHTVATELLMFMLRVVRGERRRESYPQTAKQVLKESFAFLPRINLAACWTFFPPALSFRSSWRPHLSSQSSPRLC